MTIPHTASNEISSNASGDQNLAEAVGFLSSIFDRGEYVLLRPVETWLEEGKKRSRTDWKHTTYVHCLPQMLTRALQTQLQVAEREHTNIFFGVCPRVGIEGAYDKAWQIRNVQVLWVDIDHVSVEEALGRVTRVELPKPTIVVGSGNGAHLYWKLESAFRIDDVPDPPPVRVKWTERKGFKKREEFIEDPSTGKQLWLADRRNIPSLSPQALHVQDVVKGIAKALGGDHTFDLSRLMRVAGTWNRKDQRNGQLPVPCKLIQLDNNLQYEFDVFERFAAHSPEKKRREKLTKVTLPAARKLTPTKQDRLQALLLVCNMAEVGDRSEHDFAFCAYCVEQGVSRVDAWNSASSVGKFAERGEPYFEQTWNAACEATAEKLLTKAEHKVVQAESCTTSVANVCAALSPLGNRESTDGENRARPEIDTSVKDLAAITPLAWSVLQQANNPPTLFRFGGVPSRVELNDIGEPITRALDYARMRYHLARAADFTEVKLVGEEWVKKSTAPPKDVVFDVLATPNQPLPVLTRIVETPVFAIDGTLQTNPGYHERSRTYYTPPPGFSIPEVPDHPTEQEIERARSLLCDELLGEFPFVGDAERAHALALLLVPFVRDLIEGATPLHLIEKPAPGTGATLMVEMLTLPATGRPIAAMTEARNEEEWRKRITAKLMTSPLFFFVDNLQRRLEGAALASAITGTTWEDRILGITGMAWLPVRCAWVATGNNPALSTEIARRTVRIRLDARLDRPWLRDGFRHADLRGWAHTNRALLTWAALTLVRAWLDVGRPAGPLKLGMFEHWSKTLGGILSVAKVPGFLTNLTDFYEESDAEGSSWCGFLAIWWERSHAGEVKVGDLHPIAVESCLSLGEGSEQSQRIVLGKMLAERRDRIFDLAIDGAPFRLSIQRGKQSQRSFLWRLNNVNGECRESQ